MWWELIKIVCAIILTIIYNDYIIYKQCESKGWVSLSQGQVACFPAIDAHLGSRK